MPEAFVVAAIDDDERILWSIGSLLESADYSVRLFASASAFLESGSLSQIDCLISDVDMPGVDGFRLLELVREARPGLPTIIVTGYPDRLMRATAARDLAASVFTKPFHGPDLLAAVHRATHGSRK